MQVDSPCLGTFSPLGCRWGLGKGALRDQVLLQDCTKLHKVDLLPGVSRPNIHGTQVVDRIYAGYGEVSDLCPASNVTLRVDPFCNGTDRYRVVHARASA